MGNTQLYYNLMEEVVAICNDLDSCKYIDDKDYITLLLEKLVKRFGFDINSAMWWSSGNADKFLVENDKTDWSSFYKNLQNSINEKEIYFVITNNNKPSEWFWVKLESKSLVKYIDSFDSDYEYLVFPDSLDWCLMDSNEGLLTVHGNLEINKLVGFDIRNK